MPKRVKTKIKTTVEKPELEQPIDATPEESISTSTEDATIYESVEALQDQIGRSQVYVEENKNLLVGVLVAVILSIAGYFAFSAYKGSQEEEAQGELAPAVFFFEKDSLDKAMNGDGNSTIGFLGVVDQYGSSDAANLANFYLGNIYLKKGEFDKAIESLKEFSSSDELVQARAYSLIGDAYMDKEDYASAVDFYQKASRYKPNEQFTPTYLMKLALAFEMNGEPSTAKNTYEQIVKEYPTSKEVNNAKKYLGRVE